MLTPSERAAAATSGDDESARPAANNGWSAASTRAVLTCSASATAAAIAAWPCRSPADLDPAAFVPPGFSLADMVLAGAPGLAPVVDATAAALPAARAALTAAAVAIILVRWCMRTLPGLLFAQGNQAGLRPAEEVPYRDLRRQRRGRR